MRHIKKKLLINLTIAAVLSNPFSLPASQVPASSSAEGGAEPLPLRPPASSPRARPGKARPGGGEVGDATDRWRGRWDRKRKRQRLIVFLALALALALCQFCKGII